jgi:hypothetical protein
LNVSVGAGQLFSFEGGSFPPQAFANHARGRELTALFGNNMDFYLSHFLVSAAPELRVVAEEFLRRMRSKNEFIIGVRSFWRVLTLLVVAFGLTNCPSILCFVAFPRSTCGGWQVEHLSNT